MNTESTNALDHVDHATHADARELERILNKYAVTLKRKRPYQPRYLRLLKHVPILRDDQGRLLIDLIDIIDAVWDAAHPEALERLHAN